MRITNRAGLPAPLVRAVSDQREPRRNRISVTEMIQPPQLRALTVKHWDELEEDASDRIWLIFGTAVHAIIERGSHPLDDSLAEQTLELPVEGWTVTGTADLYHQDGTLSDYKTTSVYAFMDGVRAEWEAQLNCYAYLYRTHGFPVKRLEIVAILRDWQKSRLTQSDYPRTAVITVPVPLWAPEEQAAYVIRRVRAHQSAQRDGVWADCTDAERWVRPTVYAVKKVGQKRALAGGLHETRDDAEQFARSLVDIPRLWDRAYEVEERPGTAVRCMSYCPVAHLCPQWAREYQEVPVTLGPVRLMPVAVDG